MGAWRNAVGGRSAGCEDAKRNEDSFDGLITFASYPANNEDFVDFPIPFLTIIGSRDTGAPKQAAFCEAIADSTRRGVIEGGNHRHYADYSFQKGYGIATISAVEQQE